MVVYSVRKSSTTEAIFPRYITQSLPALLETQGRILAVLFEAGYFPPLRRGRIAAHTTLITHSILNIYHHI